jgi:hypothetical protein
MNYAVTAAAQNELVTDVQVGAEGHAYVILRGRLDAQTVPACWIELERGLRGIKISTLEVDASGLQLYGGAAWRCSVTLTWEK